MERRWDLTRRRFLAGASAVSATAAAGPPRGRVCERARARVHLHRLRQDRAQVVNASIGDLAIAAALANGRFIDAHR